MGLPAHCQAHGLSPWGVNSPEEEKETPQVDEEAEYKEFLRQQEEKRLQESKEEKVSTPITPSGAATVWAPALDKRDEQKGM